MVLLMAWEENKAMKHIAVKLSMYENNAKIAA